MIKSSSQSSKLGVTETCFLFGCNTESPRALRRPKAIKPNHQNVDISDIYQTYIGHNQISEK